MAKQIVYGEHARQAVLRGINQLAGPDYFSFSITNRFANILD